MHNGFYCQSMEQDYDFLEDINNDCDVSAMDFLHGFCDCFSNILSQRFGYQREEIRDFENNLVHSYCTIILNGIRYFVDVRGITDNYEEFVSEFDDWVEWNENSKQYNYPCAFTYTMNVTKETVDNIFQFALDMVEDYTDYYDIENFVKNA